METEEAIEFFESWINNKNSAWEVRVYSELLEVVKDGKKCKQMLSEVENFIGSSDITIDEFKRIEQKYFPKEDIKK